MGLLFFALLALACSKRVFPEYTQTLEAAEGWVPAPRTSENPVLPLTIALKQKNLNTLKTFFDRVR